MEKYRLASDIQIHKLWIIRLTSEQYLGWLRHLDQILIVICWEYCVHKNLYFIYVSIQYIISPTCIDMNVLLWYVNLLLLAVIKIWYKIFTIKILLLCILMAITFGILHLKDKKDMLFDVWSKGTCMCFSQICLSNIWGGGGSSR